MNTNAALDEVHDYVDALLGSAIEPAANPPRQDAAPTVTEAMPASVPSAIVPMRVEASPVPAVRDTTPATEVAASPRTSAIVQTTHRWLRVAIGNDSYALELLCVQEVVRVTPIVAMRGANQAVLGVMNLRGRIVPVFDLGLWLGTACVQPDERSRIVVVEREDELIGVLVTLVEDVVTLAQHRIEPPLPGSARGRIVGVARVGATPTVLLDAGALFGG